METITRVAKLVRGLILIGNFLRNPGNSDTQETVLHLFVLATLGDETQTGWFRFELGHPSKAKASKATVAVANVFAIKFPMLKQLN